jgi:nitrite reductase (NO-forming)
MVSEKNMNKLWIFVCLIIIIIVAGVVYQSNSSKYASSIQPALPVDIQEISTRADDLPLPIFTTRSGVQNKTVSINLRATQVIANLSDGTTYEYWTYNNQVPGPFIRVMQDDMVEISLTHEHAHDPQHHSAVQQHSLAINALVPLALADDGHDHENEEMMNSNNSEDIEHIMAGHGEHSIDLHAVLGPGGGAELMRVDPNNTKTFRFKATRPGIYIYHCASPHVPSHIANGMYGMILVEPQGGLPQVDREFYVVQGEFYTTGKLGTKGHQELDKEKLLTEKPEYIVFNGRMGALTADRAMRAKVGEKIRIFFGVSGQLASNFHIIGEIFDSLYADGDIISPPRKNVQTTLVPGGGATMVEFTAEVPGKYLLVDHALSRAIDRGAIGELIVESE